MTDKNIEISTDALEIVFDSNVKHLAVPDYIQAEQVADSIIKETMARQDPYYAFEAIRQFDHVKDLIGLAKAKVLHFLNKYWIEFQIQTPFLEAVSAYIGINNLDVIKRYIKIWDMFEKGKVPDKYVVELKAKPINELTPIMGLLQAGYEVTEENWEMLLHTRGNVPISKYIRDEIKKTEPRSQAIFYSIDKNNGMLYATTNGTRYRIGRIVFQGQEEPAKRAISRLVETMKITILNEEENEEN